MTKATSRRRHVLLLLPALAFAAPASRALAAAAAEEQAAWSALREGAIVLFRHANAPGVGDPPGFSLGACATQRNLDEGGREQARRIGARFKREGVPVAEVWSSQWCRARDTAELAALKPVRDVAAFNSFFGERGDEPAQTAAARQLLLGWRERGTLVVVTHQVNISALTGQGTASGEGVVLRAEGGVLKRIGRIQP